MQVRAAVGVVVLARDAEPPQGPEEGRRVLERALSVAQRGQAQGADTILEGLKSVREATLYQRTLLDQLSRRVAG